MLTTYQSGPHVDTYQRSPRDYTYKSGPHVDTSQRSHHADYVRRMGR